MVISESLVSIIFRTINTLMVAVCVVYIFKKYALVKIKAAMSKKEQELIDLRLKSIKLELEIKKSELRIKQEEESAVRMQDKIIQWREMVDTMHKVRRTHQELLLSSVMAQQAAKRAYLYSTSIRNQVAPRAIGKAQEQLKKHFESSDAAQQYIADIVAIMQMGEQWIM